MSELTNQGWATISDTVTYRVQEGLPNTVWEFNILIDDKPTYERIAVLMTTDLNELVVLRDLLTKEYPEAPESYYALLARDFVTKVLHQRTLVVSLELNTRLVLGYDRLENRCYITISDDRK